MLSVILSSKQSDIFHHSYLILSFMMIINKIDLFNANYGGCFLSLLKITFRGAKSCITATFQFKWGLLRVEMRLFLFVSASVQNKTVYALY